MTFVDPDMQWSLSALIASVEVTSSPVQHVYHSRLVTESCVVDSSVSIFILGQTYKQTSLSWDKQTDEYSNVVTKYVNNTKLDV